MSAQKFKCNPMTEEECQQMVGMYNWAAENTLIQKMELKTFKQRGAKDRVTTLWYEIEAIIWMPNNKWKLIMEKGRTLTEAMENWSKQWKIKSEEWSTL